MAPATTVPMPAPLALATRAPNRILAWPRFDQPGDLAALFALLGPSILSRPDVCLCLRCDPALDGAPAAVARALEAALAQATGGSPPACELLLVDDALDERGWTSLGAAVTATVALPSSGEPARRARLNGLPHAMCASAGELWRAIGGGPAPAPIVTAIVSTYKAAGFLRGCLDDLLAQTLYSAGQLEIVVIDSGSPENEGELVRAAQAQHARIVYLRTERETIYGAWNRGVALARGRYLTNANTDDRHRADALEILARHLDQRPEIAVVAAGQLVTQQPNETFARNSARQHFSWPPTITVDELLGRCVVGPQPMWRRALHDRWGLFDDRFTVAGDYEFWLRVARSGERFDRLPEILGLYYQNPAGLENASPRTVDETQRVRAMYSMYAPFAPQRRAATAR
ncbi:MAG TPA: glycosyltransferase [Polyangia bacterium]|nr:glycosyltransferase [Polyangia bacterium]